jgi:hypothetical protein
VVWKALQGGYNIQRKSWHYVGALLGVWSRLLDQQVENRSYGLDLAV